MRSPPLRWSDAAAILVLIATAGATAMVYPSLPERFAVHFDASGTPDSFYGRTLGAAIVPAISVAMYVMFRVLPVIDPRGENFRKFRPTYDAIVLLTLAFLGFVQGLLLAYNLGIDYPQNALVLGGVGLLFAGLGVLFRRAEPNWFVGIRTPWTLSDDEVWRRTHRVAAPVFVLAGVLIAAGAFLPFPTEFVVGVAAAIAALVPAAYSFVVYRGRDQHETDSASG
ncbi:SdpI family protein [Haloglomus halophilum]|uniref:SdpI family protein n=1 Tax=Haloglomus halophilum TaxID=2962672 RepID=UPI0020C9999A|nr:SdpI family protein [Haloglomus halophilum]